MLVALGTFCLAAVLVLALERWLIEVSEGIAVGEWLTEHVYSPVLRALAVLAFVLSGYPALYGLAEAPALGELLAAGHHRFDTLVNLLLLVSLLLPLAPYAERLPGLALPLQGVTGSCVLFHWLAAAQAVEARLWMGWQVFGEVLAIGVAASGLARLLSRPTQPRRSHRLVAELLLLLAQLPAIALYSRALGRQL